MRRPIIITGRRPTPEETGKLYGLSKRRTRQIIDMVEKSLAKRSYGHLYYGSSLANKNGSAKPERYSASAKANGRGQAKRKSKTNTARSKAKIAKAKASH